MAVSECVLQRVVIVGAGLIGTSVALALRGQGIEVLLTDQDPVSLDLAVSMGAGEPLPEPMADPADLAVLAVPPDATAGALALVQKQGLAWAYTDVASVKERPLREAEALGCDMAAFVAGHPMAGGERSGPLNARSQLFAARPWVLCPTAESGGPAVAAATALAKACGAVPVTMEAAVHDRAVALTSHAPHAVASAMAARFAEATEEAMLLTGQGVRDVTRIAAGDPRLWFAILSANAEPVAEVLDAVAGDLQATAAELRVSAGARTRSLLERGTAGHARIPGKHGGPPGRYAGVPVLVSDRPGELALLFHAASVAGVNVEDITIEHSPGRSVGVVELAVLPESADDLARDLRARGWAVPER
jgi:prephenate dehydrogenase